MERFWVKNFGCRASQADGAAIEAGLVSRGLAAAGELGDADLVVLNTCQHPLEPGNVYAPRPVEILLKQVPESGKIFFVRQGIVQPRESVLAQWQKATAELGRQVVWPKAAQSADLIYPIAEATH